MALTISDWTTTKTSGILTSTCTVIATTAESDAYTKKTSPRLDLSKSFTLYYKASATPDGQALPLDLWIGGESLLLSGDSTTVAAADGANWKQIMDDVVLAVDPVVYAFDFDPKLAVADVVTVGAIATGLKVKIPTGATRIAFNCDGGSTLAAATHTFKIVQNQKR